LTYKNNKNYERGLPYHLDGVLGFKDFCLEPYSITHIFWK